VSNFFIGIITGLISGWIVASYYRSKEKEEQWLKELFFDKQNLSRFAELLSLELDILRSELKNGVEPMQEEINNILKNIIKRPQFPSFDEKRLPQWAQEIALNYNEVFNHNIKKLDIVNPLAWTKPYNKANHTRTLKIPPALPLLLSFCQRNIVYTRTKAEAPNKA